MPSWFAETRRRMFCDSYNQDKSIATFLGRPIRISRRHTDVTLPLDVSDEELYGDETTLTQAINALDKNGWNTKGRWLRASWIVCILYFKLCSSSDQFQRLRYSSYQFREEVLEFSLIKLDDSSRRQLL